MSETAPTANDVILDLTADSRPTSPGQARAVAARLAQRLVQIDAATTSSTNLLVQAEQRADSQLGHLVEATTSLASAGGVVVVTEVPEEVVDDAQHPAVVEAERILAEQKRAMGRGRRSGRPEGRLEQRLVFCLSFTVFLALGYYVSVVGGLIPGDAISRLNSAQSVLVGRDPHLEAIGFIWGPLATIFTFPFVLLRSFWLPFTAAGMAAVVVSAAFMAGALAQLVAWGRECGAPRWCRVVALVLFAAHPLVWAHGIDGMSEAVWIFFLMVAVRHLARWVETDDVKSLVMTAVAVALGYLTRYETVGVFAAVVPIVAVVSWQRSAGSPDHERSVQRRQWETVVDLTIFAFPFIVAFLAWAGASWVIINEPFPQFSSEYGNGALVRDMAPWIAEMIGDPSMVGRGWFFTRQALIAAPMLAVLIVLVMLRSTRTAWRGIAAIAVFGAPLGLQLLLAMRASTFPWLRYVIVGVGLTALLVLAIVGDRPKERRPLMRVLVLAALIPGIVWSTVIIRAGEYSSLELTSIMEILLHHRPGDPVDTLLSDGQKVARDIDAIDDVEPGTVLMDQASVYLWGAAPRANVYVVPADRDFEPALSAPAEFGIRYVLLLEEVHFDAVMKEYPGLWEDRRPDFATLAEEWGSEADPASHYKLFKIVDPDPRNRAKPDPEFGR